MNKMILSICLMGLIDSACAGMMGNVSVADYFVPFASGEGSVTWNTIKSVYIFDHPSSLSKQLWGGRGAVGLAHTLPNRFGYTAEMGWGYYGSTSSHNFGSAPQGSLGITNSGNLYGFDLLAGLTYDFTSFQVNLKAGAMSESRHINGTAVFRNTNNGNNYLSTNQLQSVSTNTLPEIKVGGLYFINENIGLSLAYMHVFGNDNFVASVTGAFSSPQATQGIASVTSAQNPSLDSLLFGLIYQFK